MFVSQRFANFVDVRQGVLTPGTISTWEILLTDTVKAVPGAGGADPPAGFIAGPTFPNVGDPTAGNRDIWARTTFDPADYTAAAVAATMDIRDVTAFFACIRGITSTGGILAAEPLRVIPAPRRAQGAASPYPVDAPKSSWLRVPLIQEVAAIQVRNTSYAIPASLAFIDPSPAHFSQWTILEANTEIRLSGPGLREVWIYGEGDSATISFTSIYEEWVSGR